MFLCHWTLQNYFNFLNIFEGYNRCAFCLFFNTEIFPLLMEIPSLGGPFIEGDIFYFTCSFTTIIQTDNDVFDVLWTADATEIVNFTTTNSTSALNGTLLKGFLNKKVIHLFHIFSLVFAIFYNRKKTKCNTCRIS